MQPWIGPGRSRSGASPDPSQGRPIPAAVLLAPNEASAFSDAGADPLPTECRIMTPDCRPCAVDGGIVRTGSGGSLMRGETTCPSVRPKIRRGARDVLVSGFERWGCLEQLEITYFHL